MSVERSAQEILEGVKRRVLLAELSERASALTSKTEEVRREWAELALALEELSPEEREQVNTSAASLVVGVSDAALGGDDQAMPDERARRDGYVLDLLFGGVVRVRVEYSRDDLVRLCADWRAVVEYVLAAPSSGQYPLAEYKWGGRRVAAGGALDDHWQMALTVLPEGLDPRDFDQLPPEQQAECLLPVWADRFRRTAGDDPEWAAKLARAERDAEEMELYLTTHLRGEIARLLDRCVLAAEAKARFGDELAAKDYAYLGWLPPPGLDRYRGRGGKRKVVPVDPSPAEASRFLLHYGRLHALLDDANKDLKPRGRLRGKPGSLKPNTEQTLREARIDADLIEALKSKPPQWVAAEQAARWRFKDHERNSKTLRQLRALIKKCQVARERAGVFGAVEVSGPVQ
jgi:hypothetical protein